MEALVTIANGLFILGYFARDLLKVRALSFAGACCLAFYFAFRADPLVQVAYWNLFFAGLNAAWVGRLVYERRMRASPPGK